MSEDFSLEERKYLLETDASADLYVVHMVREEALSELFTITIVAVADEHTPAADIVGEAASVKLEALGEGGTETYYHGLCTDCSYEGMVGGIHVYRLILRPELWLLTQRSNYKIFQAMTAPDIINEVLSNGSISAPSSKGSAPTRPEREYCVQYGETDYDFVHRLMAEEGIFYLHEHQESELMLFTAEDGSALDDLQAPDVELPDDATDPKGVLFQKTETLASLDEARITIWRSNQLVRSEVSKINDYNHENPTAQLESSKTIDNNKKGGPDLELYEYPGRFRESGRGTDLVGWLGESRDAPTSVWEGKCNIQTMVTGRIFKLYGHPVESFNSPEYLIISTKHTLRAEMDLIQAIISNGAMRDLFGEHEAKIATEAEQTAADRGGMGADTTAVDAFSCEFTAQEATVPYRTPQNCPKPIAYNTEPAMVVGPEGEEINVDEFGRVKCHFFWDRDSQKDDTSSAWIRVMQPGFAHDRWGQQFIPRIDQEVVVAFQRGDPDRPIVIGAVYHHDQKPPYKLPDNKTQSGIKTHSSKDAEGYHELLFEDKAGEEFVRFQSQKDYHQIIKNKMLTSVGYEEQDNRGVDESSHLPTDPAAPTGGSVTSEGADGDCALKVKQNYNVEVDQGDHNIKVSSSNQNIDVATDRTTNVGGNHEENITGTQDITVTGACTIESTTSIELKVGSSSVKLDMSGVTIKGAMVKCQATGTGEFDGGGMLTLKGGLVKIN